jgi:hypothetical protein
VAGRDDYLHRQAIGIGQSMDFRSKAAPNSSKISTRVALCKVAAAGWTRTLVPKIMRTSLP